MDAFSTVNIREAIAAEAEALAHLWHDAWQDAHAHLVPASLAPHRTIAFFRHEIDMILHRALVLVSGQRLIGFTATRADELSHFFIASDVRGRGVAGRLLRRVETEFLKGGVEEPFLICVTGNDRARRFYTRMGWEEEETFVHTVTTPDGPVPLDACRMRKRLVGSDAAPGPVDAIEPNRTGAPGE